MNYRRIETGDGTHYLLSWHDDNWTEELCIKCGNPVERCNDSGCSVHECEPPPAESAAHRAREEAADNRAPESVGERLAIGFGMIHQSEEADAWTD